MDEFDFIKGFADVDLLAAEAIAKVIGRVIGILFEGMVEAGVSEANAHKIIRGAVSELFTTMLRLSS